MNIINKTTENIDNKLCEYGCANVAKYITSNSKLCCSGYINSCEGIKKGAALNRVKKSNTVTVSRPSWNKGLTKESDTRIKKGAETYINNIKTGKVIRGPLSYEQRRNLSIALKGKTGGCRRGSGRGKKGWYKGFWCDSSWELAYVIYNLEHNIAFERNTEGFEYTFNGEKHFYYPDFKEENTYVEIKNFKTNKFSSKIECFKKPLKVLMKNDLKTILEYVNQRYGADFIKLYEDYKERPKNIYICKCGGMKSNKDGVCIDCGNYKKRKIKDRPSKEQLFREVEDVGYVRAGKKYGVSDNAIRKWIKKHAALAEMD